MCIGMESRTTLTHSALVRTKLTWRTVLGGEAIDEGVPTGPLWGPGRLGSKGSSMEVEVGGLKDRAEITEALEFVGLTQKRRPLSA